MSLLLPLLTQMLVTEAKCLETPGFLGVSVACFNFDTLLRLFSDRFTMFFHDLLYNFTVQPSMTQVTV